MAGKNIFMRMAFTVIAILAFLAPEAKTASQKSTNTQNNSTMRFSLNPDFVFPRNVVKNADAELEKALQQGDNERALLAAMQVFVGRQLTASDSIDSHLHEFAATSRRLSPFCRSLANLFQARVLSERFEEDQWELRGRVVPGKGADLAIGLWGEAQYADSVITLLDEAFRVLPWKEGEQAWKNLYFCLDNPRKAYGNMLTVKDFVLLSALRSLDCFASPAVSERLLPLNVVGASVEPEKEISPVERVAAYRNRMTETYLNALTSNSSELAWGEGADIISNDTRSPKIARLQEMLTRAEGSAGQVPVLAAMLAASNEYGIYSISQYSEINIKESAEIEKRDREIRRLINEGRALLTRYPGALYKDNLQQQIASLTTPAVRAQFRQQYLPGLANQKVNVSLENINSVYMLIIRDLRSKTDAPPTLESIRNAHRLVAALPVATDAEIPFSKGIEVSLPELEPGSYVMIPSKSKTLAGAIPARREDLDRFVVSSFAALTAQESSEVREYAVNGLNGTPLDGVDLNFRQENWKGKKVFGSLTTGIEGFVSIPEAWKSSNKVLMSKGDDTNELDIRINNASTQEPERRYALTLLPSRAILRPGDELQFAGIAYSTLGTDIRLEKENRYFVRLIGANGELTDSLQVTTDAMGRFEGKFIIPREGLLGNWMLVGGRDGIPESHFEGVCGINVEEYSNPTYRLILERPEMMSDSVVRLTGRAETFSGMGVAGARVDLDIKTRVPRWWFFTAPSAAYHCQTTTGGDGRFSIELSTAGLKGTTYENVALTLAATAVSPGGETQRDEVKFSIGEGYTLVPAIEDIVEATDKEQTFIVRGFDLQDKPSVVKAFYSLTDVATGKILSEGDFMTPSLVIDTDTLPSAEYKLKVWLENEEQTPREKSFTLWRRDDTVPPSELALWIPEKTLTASPNQSEMTLIVGSSYTDQKILCTVSTPDSIVERRWLSPEGKNMKLSFPTPADDSRLFVTLTTVRNLKSYSTTATLCPSSADRRMDLEKISFRDRLTAGDKEEWKFRFHFNDEAETGKVAAMGVMTDMALDRLVPFKWYFSPRDALSFGKPFVIRFTNIGKVFLYDRIPGTRANFNQFYFQLPFWVYGIGNNIVSDKYMAVEEKVFYSVAAPLMASNVMIRGTRSSVMRKEAMSGGAVTESADDSSAEYESGAGSVDDGGRGGADEALPYREAEFPLAFFKPMLESDNEGVVTLSFEVPDFNTTWKLQLLGYDERLYSARESYEALSAKEVMVSGSMPRFLRTGDKASLTATLFNNSVKPLKIGGRIEILDAVSGRLIASRKYKEETVETAGSRLIGIEFDVPNDITSILVRSSATGGGHSDGEQELIPVLPSSSPVVESVPFYLAPAEKNFELKLPEMEAGGKVTLLYCDNPAWYALTALPSLVSNINSSSSISVLRAYYGNSIGLGLLSFDPTLRDGLTAMLRDSNDNMKTSPLELNESLKIAALKSTPWLLDARSETGRMQSLGSLLDKKGGEEKLEALFAELLRFRNQDGGISWCSDAPSSDWATGRALLYLSMLNRFGFLSQTQEMKDFVSGLDGYIMSQLVGEWKEIKKGRKMTSSQEEESLASLLVNALYIRSAFTTTPGMLAPLGATFREMEAKALRGIESGWRSMGIYEKATAATLLWRSGKKETARTILESLSQFASESKEKGMWFANLESGPWSPWNSLITTAQVLEAWAEIEPDSPAVDRLRQWMLIQRQSQDWSLESYGAELVASILSSGTQWTSPTDSALRISLDGKEIIDGKQMPAYGEAIIDLDRKQSSGATLRIERDGASPAWGGVMEQYVSPIKDIESAAIDDLKIEKSLFVMRQKDGHEVALTLDEAGTLSVGDKVRVLLTVECGRNLEYVLLRDERGATLEPSDQLSSGDIIDSVWLYREVRDSQTNFYIPYLRKGKFQISYECRLSLAGDYTAGIATIQSQYAPTLTAHSAGLSVTVK